MRQASGADWHSVWRGDRVQHVRFCAGYASTGGDDFAVVTIWPAKDDSTTRGAVLVLSGNGNETCYKFDGYKQIVVVTWLVVGRYLMRVLG